MQKEKIILFTDGGARGNPGPAGIGIVIADDKGNILKEVSKFLGDTTNNFAEYEAVIEGLRALKRVFGTEKLKDFDIEVKLDSELVANQLSGTYQIKEESLFPQFIRIHNMQVKDFPKIKFSHIPREKNKEADRLANEAMDAA
ncbi:MAG: ribonuclease HI family protein [Candidatus Pacebacteria bacterium]|jgi:ribonuclease HI|nr:ribonuclease HI family protein [Candidatus Paceibacterota bacterium]|tara:strand:+ start:11418 stop:11846 length:429 start_codon:yes stop_codon:yes gene_type:complete